MYQLTIKNKKNAYKMKNRDLGCDSVVEGVNTVHRVLGFDPWLCHFKRKAFGLK